MNLQEMLTQDEGLRLTVYDDATGKAIVPGYTVVGHPTIGVGRALDLDGITADEAFLLRDNNIARVTRAAETFPWFSGLDSVRRDVMVMMIFNMGLGRFCEFKLMIAAMATGDFQGAATEMLSSQWHTQVGARAERLAQMVVSGAYPS